MARGSCHGWHRAELESLGSANSTAIGVLVAHLLPPLLLKNPLLSPRGTEQLAAQG